MRELARTEASVTLWFAAAAGLIALSVEQALELLYQLIWGRPNDQTRDRGGHATVRATTSTGRASIVPSILVVLAFLRLLRRRRP